MEDTATDGDPIYVIAASAALKKFEPADRDAEEYWRSLGGDRDDARQEALLRAWKAFEGHNGKSELILHLMVQARFGLLDYVRELREDREKASPTRVVQAGLDDEKIEWTFPEVSLDDEDCALQPESQQEVPGTEAEREEGSLALRSIIEPAMLSCLSKTEAFVVRARFGIGMGERSGSGLASSLGLSEARVSQILASALDKLRAEMRADEIARL